MKKIISLIAFVLALVGFASPVEAGQLKGAKVSLSDTDPSATAVHTYAFTTVQAATVKSLKFQYCTTPSGDCTKPAGLTTTAATLGTFGGAMVSNAGWTIVNGVNGTIGFTKAAGIGLQTNEAATLSAGNITNHAIDNCQAAGDISSDTCYVTMTIYDDESYGGNALDSTIASVTVTAYVTVTARVDPTFTFVVQSTAANATYGSNQITTSVASTFSTLPFGNLTAGTPKYAAHALYVTTNTQNGYTVDAKLSTQMTGSYSSNNIDPFIATWGTPTTWTEPTGSTPNDNTGWFGANTTDTDVTGWAAPAGKFAGVASSAVTVMQSSSSDNGVTPTYVTYAVEANVFQPSDSYTGKLVYSAVPTY